MPVLARIASLGAILCGLVGLDGASADIVITQCGSLVSSTVRTSNGPTVATTSDNFRLVPGASIVVNVPDGANRCIKVRFSAEVATNGTGIIQARDNATALHPQNGELAYLTNEADRASHDYEWVLRVGPGSHNIKIQWRTEPEHRTFTMYTWTMDVEVLN